MTQPVIAIGLDAADPDLLNQWMDEGLLNNLRDFRDAGAYGEITNVEAYRAETPWTTFLTGCWPETTGHWGPIDYVPATYDSHEKGAYDFAQHPPFYALGKAYRVAVFDMPQVRLVNTVNGVQVVGWGSHSQQCASASVPANLLSDLRQQYGVHPAYDEASQGTSDHANCYDAEALLALKQKLLTGIARRSAIFQHLLRQERWRLCMTLFAEVHSSGHSLWHLSHPHPLFSLAQQQRVGDAMTEVFQAVDREIGNILNAVPNDARVAIFSGHGMQANAIDVPSMFFLAEFMYRWNFGRAALAAGDRTLPLAAPQTTFPQHWKHELWEMRSRPHAEADLASPTVQQAAADSLHWMPANWYKRSWHKMRAFALPSYSEGQIRINLAGREGQGIVAPDEYDAICDKITRALYQLTDARTGQPMVTRVVRTRQDPFQTSDSSGHLPPADLLVHWQETHPTDTLDSPQFGRIGPVPFFRTGGHRSKGFLMVNGAGTAAGSRLPRGTAVDLPATLLRLMDAPQPAYMEGQALVKLERVAPERIVL